MPKGTSAFGDVLRRTTDGRSLVEIWNEHQATLRLWNQRRTAFDRLLSFPTVNPAEEVAQTTSGDSFENATEFGEPVGIRSAPDTHRFGLDLRWYDLASRFTWKFLAEADASQVAAVHNLVLEADSRLTHNEIMRALLAPVSRVNEDGTPILGLWNGDEMVPPDHLGESFGPAHNHFFTTAGALTGDDLALAITAVTEHGYGASPGSQVVVFAHPTEAQVIRGFRVANGDPFDFIAGEAAPAYLTDQQIIGDAAPESFEDLPLIGAYGSAFVSESRLVPVGYVAVVATGGGNNPANAVGFREHRRPELRGLRQIRGGSPDYPMTDSFYARGFGTGVRHRGAASVLKVTADANYSAPVIPAAR